MNYTEEFETVNLLRSSSTETRGVDSFALTLIKAERQIRKLVTHLVFQYPCFTSTYIPKLKTILSDNRRVYFEGVVNGFNTIYPKSIKTLIGNKHDSLQEEITKAIKYRNKIFHGQLTNDDLTRDDLFLFVDSISEWCKLLAEGAENEIGFNGFTRNSFQKSSQNELYSSFKIQLTSLEDYKNFIKQNMQRP